MEMLQEFECQKPVSFLAFFEQLLSETGCKGEASLTFLGKTALKREHRKGEALLIWVTCRPPSRANFLLVSSAAFPPLAACCFKQAGGSAGDAGSGAFGVLDVALILDALTLGG